MNFKGYVQVYTGEGKGKTTAALGLTVRAVGAGLRVFIGQFIKGKHCSEINALATCMPAVTVRQFGRGCFIRKDPAPEDIDAARHGLDETMTAMLSGQYDVIIADEANAAVHAKLFPAEALLKLIDGKPENVELVLTGRNAPQSIIDRADLVTEMKDIKHYYDKGIQARPGIES